MALRTAKDVLQAAATEPVRLLLPLVPPATAVSAGSAHPQVPSAAADALAPPLHLLPGGRLAGDRTAFHGPDGRAWKARSHAFPAAWPRSLPTGTAPPGRSIPPPGLTKEAAAKAWHDMLPSVESAALAVMPITEAEHAQVIQQRIQNQERQLWSVVERIIPARPHGSEVAGAQHINLVLAHANGLHKETFEPFLASLLAKLPSDVVVDAIWSIDTLNQGESGLLNREGLGAGLVVWPDLARDVLQFIKHYLPSTKPSETIGDQIPRAEGDAPPPRTVLIGHSYGACLAGMVANAHPELIDTLIMMDPPLSHPPVYSVDGLPPLLGPDGNEVPRGRPIPDEIFPGNDIFLMKFTSQRRDAWPSRAAAAAALSRTPFYREWHPAARELFMEKALVALPREDGSIPARDEETDDVPAGLSTSKYSEAATFGSQWSGNYISLSLLSGAFGRYWAQRAGPNDCKGKTFIAFPTQWPWYGLLSPYFERVRVVDPSAQTSMAQQREEGEQLRSDCIHGRVEGVPTEMIAGWDELLKRFSIKGEAAIFPGSNHMLPQIQPDEVAAVVADWLKETITPTPTSHL